MANLLRPLALLLSSIVLVILSITTYNYGIPLYRSLSNVSWVENLLTAGLKQPVHIERITPHWQSLEPTIDINNLSITDSNGNPDLEIKRLKLGINLFASFIKWKIIPGTLTIEGTHLTIREKPNGVIIVNNIKALEGQLQSKDSEKIAYLLDCFLTNGVKKLKDIDLTWYDQSDNIVMPLSQLNMVEESSFLSRHFSGHAFSWNGTSISFQGKTRGTFVAKNLLYTQAKVQVNNMPLQNTFISRSFKDIHLQQGQANLDVVIFLNPHSLNMNGLIKSQNILFQIKNHEKVYPIPEASTRLTFCKNENKFELSLKQLKLKLANEWLPIHELNFKEFGKLKNVTQVLQVDTLPVSDTSQFILDNQLVSEKINNALMQLAPKGQITKFSLQRNPATGTKDLLVSGHLKGISFLPWQQLPGMQNLSGNITLNPHQGVFHLDSKNLIFQYQPMFRDNLPIKKLNGQFSWNEGPESNWFMRMKDVELITKEGKITGFMDVSIPSEKESPEINSKFAFDVWDLSQAAKYYPVSIMPPNTVRWLENSIKGGSISKGVFIMNGRLKNFPFYNEKGKFLITGDLKKGKLHYQDGWPDVTGIKACVSFEGRSMKIISKHAYTLGAKVHYALAEIENLDKPNLVIKGKVSSLPLQEIKVVKQNNPLLKFLNYSELSDLNVHGKWQLLLNIFLPLGKDNEAPTKVHGLVKLGNVRVDVGKYLTLNNLVGNLDFKDDSAETPLLTGQLFNKPLKLSIVSGTDIHGKYSTLDLNAFLDVVEIQKIFGDTLLKNISGSTPFHLKLNTHKTEFGKPRTVLNIASNLQGIHSVLPTPFNKTEKALAPSYFQLEDQTTFRKIIFNCENKLNGILSFKKTDNDVKFDRGEVQLGMQKAQLPTASGFKLSGKLSDLDFNKWKAVLKSGEHFNASFSQNIKKLQTFLQIVNLKIDRIHLKDSTLLGTTLKVLPKKQGITIAVENNTLMGEAQIPNTFPVLPLKVNLRSLTLAGNQSFHTDLRPRDIPNLDLFISNFNFKDKVIKNVDLKLRTEGNTLLIKQALIKDSSLNVSATGHWKELDGKHVTSLSGSFNSSNLGAILNQWKVTDTMVKGQGSGHFNLKWMNPPSNLESKTLDGSMDLQFNKGRIIKLGTKATIGMDMGRVLTLFSLETLQRRLMLDFSDLTEPGFSFDELKGILVFKQGNVFTEDAFIDGPVAKVKINGRIGLVDKDYNLRLTINPNVTSSLPVVATLTAGPIVGAATWLADKIFSSQVKQMTAIHYNVTGTWDNPNLKNLTETK